MEKRSHRRIRDLVALTAFQGLDANEIGCARSIRSRWYRFDACFVIAPLQEDSEGDPRQLICERDCQNVTMQTPSRSREPGSKAVLRPARRMKLNSTGALDEEHAQIAISTLGDAAKYRSITGRQLLRH